MGETYLDMEPDCQWIGWRPLSYDPKIASVRIRCFNLLPQLQSYAVPVELFQLQHAHRYKAVVYSKRYDDASYAEAIDLRGKGIRIIFDICDNHFYNPKKIPDWDKAGERLRRMISIADHLVASTEAMKEVICSELSEPRPITIIGDAVEDKIEGVFTLPWQRWYHQWKLAALLRQLNAYRDQGATPIVWFGHHGSPYSEGGMLDLLKIRTLLEQIHCQYPLSLTVISNSRLKYRKAILPWSIPTHYLEWHSDTFLFALRAHSISIIPISRNPFTICKSNNRLTLSLHHGLAVIADSIPSYKPFETVSVLDDWETGLKRYLSDPELRHSHVRIGQEVIAKKWSLSYIAKQWQSLFSEI